MDGLKAVPFTADFQSRGRTERTPTYSTFAINVGHCQNHHRRLVIGERLSIGRRVRSYLIALRGCWGRRAIEWFAGLDRIRPWKPYLKASVSRL